MIWEIIPLLRWGAPQVPFFFRVFFTARNAPSSPCHHKAICRDLALTALGTKQRPLRANKITLHNISLSGENEEGDKYIYIYTYMYHYKIKHSVYLLVAKKCRALKKYLKIILHIHWATIVDTKNKLFAKMKYQQVFFLEINLKIRYLSPILMMLRIGQCK